MFFVFKGYSSLTLDIPTVELLVVNLLLHCINCPYTLNQHSTCFSVFTEAPSFAEPGDAIMEKVANSKVIIPCPAEGMK